MVEIKRQVDSVVLVTYNPRALKKPHTIHNAIVLPTCEKAKRFIKRHFHCLTNLCVRGIPLQILLRALLLPRRLLLLQLLLRLQLLLFGDEPHLTKL